MKSFKLLKIAALADYARRECISQKLLFEDTTHINEQMLKNIIKPYGGNVVINRSSNEENNSYYLKKTATGFEICYSEFSLMKIARLIALYFFLFHQTKVGDTILFDFEKLEDKAIEAEMLARCFLMPEKLFAEVCSNALMYSHDHKLFDYDCIATEFGVPVEQVITHGKELGLW